MLDRIIEQFKRWIAFFVVVAVFAFGLAIIHLIFYPSIKFIPVTNKPNGNSFFNLYDVHGLNIQLPMKLFIKQVGKSNTNTADSCTYQTTDNAYDKYKMYVYVNYSTIPYPLDTNSLKEIGKGMVLGTCAKGATNIVYQERGFQKANCPMAILATGSANKNNVPMDFTSLVMTAGTKFWMVVMTYQNNKYNTQTDIDQVLNSIQFDK